MVKHKKKDTQSVLRRPMLPVLALLVAAAALAVSAIVAVAVVHERDRVDTLYKLESKRSSH